MSRRIVVVVAGAALLAAAALAQGPESWDKKTLKAAGEGRAVYLVHCTGCHGVDARGGMTGTNHVAAPDLTLIAVRDGGFDARHVAIHVDGRKAPRTSEMPCYGEHFRLAEWPSGEGHAAIRVHNLTHYLELVQVPEAAEPVER